jgi:serine phosphatase RsbU (regulator of sigma subunit)
MKKRWILFLWLFLAVFSLNAQIKNIGLPFIKNYTPKETGGYPENLDIKQDKRGVMYFCNTKGLIEFDGVKWQMHYVPNKSIIWGIDIDDKGFIYIGAQDEFGYFAPDKQGKLVYYSLLKLIPEKDQLKVNNIWKVDVTPNGVIFRGNKIFYIYKDGRLTQVSVPNFITASLLRNNILFFATLDGLFTLKDGKVELILKENPVSGKDLVCILPFAQNNLLLFDSKMGGSIFNGTQVIPWNPKINSFLIAGKIRASIPLNNGYFAFATRLNGLLVIDKEGNPVQHLNTNTGLQSNTVTSLFLDRDNGLWLGLSYGIDYVSINSPFTYFSESEVPGIPYCSTVKDKNIYFGTNQGLFTGKMYSYKNPLDPSGKTSLVNDIKEVVWSVYKDDNSLVCGTATGAFQIEGNNLRQFSTVKGGWIFLPIVGSPGYYLEGTYDGISLLQKKNDKWTFVHQINNFKVGSRAFVQIDSTTFWMCNNTKGLFKIKFDKKFDSVVYSKRYTENDGLPSAISNKVFRVNNEIVFAGEKGLFSYNKKTDSFSPNKTYDRFLDREKQIYLKQDPQKNIWYVNGETIGVLKYKEGNTYDNQFIPFNKFKGSLFKIYEMFDLINVIDSQNVVLATIDNGVHYDNRIVENYKKPFHILIRKVENTAGKDSLILDGNFTDESGQMIESQYKDKVLSFPFTMNAFRFNYAATYFEDPDKTEYRYQLKGFEPHWSEWTNKTTKEYTNLHEGKYTFLVQAKNIYEIESNVASYSFEIKEPWYRTYLAYFFFFVLAGVVLWLVIQGSLFRLKKRNERLELQVRVRTNEIHTQKDLLQLKNKEITDSINYSKRIQDAILPSKNEIYSKLKDSFVFYQPKDIVSGDFYWFFQTIEADVVMIAAADCTGHGVPGAFMSMLGEEKLKEAAKVSTDPGMVLQLLNKSIKETLHQSDAYSLENNTRDGMDIAICTINLNTRMVSYAGANRPLWILKKSVSQAPEIIEIKAEKAAIGGLTDSSQSFKTHTFQFEKGSSFYIFSDGYPDQFGGEKGKKLMTKKFKEILLDIGHKPMHEQETYLAEFITSWKGDFSQVDDILIIGIRLL